MKCLLSLLLFLAPPWSTACAEPLSIYTEISPPSQYLGPDGQLTGFSIELVREIQRRVGNTDAIQVVPWARSYGELQSRPNVALFSIARSEERAHLFQWVGPIRELNYQFYVRTDSHIVIKNLEDAKKLSRIGVYKDDVREQYLTRQGFKNLDRSVDNTIIVKKLMAGRIEAFVSRPDAIDQVLRTAGFNPKDVRGAYSFLTLGGYIAFSKSTPAGTVKKWAAALESIKKDGAYKRFAKKYFPDTP